MGRHRSDPLGIARIVLIVLAVCALLSLIVVGVVGLLSATDPIQAPDTPVPPAASAQAARTAPATLQIACQAESCPVFVRIPGGDVLLNGQLSKGEQVAYFDGKLDVVLDDASLVKIWENGKPRPPVAPGEPASFTVSRGQGQPS
ncbi:hypothetical protein [Herbidospora sp. RD11066]